jgi:uncharacterized protein YndB with AHSA1/START domain
MPLKRIDAGDDVTLVWHIHAASDRVWQCLTGAPGLEQWLGRLVSGEVRTGAELTVDHGDGYLCSSTVMGCVDGARLDLTWEFPDEAPSRVVVDLDETDGVTVLRLRHSELGDLAESYRLGWCVHLAYLEAASLGTPLPASMFWPIHGTLASLAGP